MKVTLSTKGKLTITAESGVEGYALKKWFDEYQENKGGGATLMIEVIGEGIDGSAGHE